MAFNTDSQSPSTAQGSLQDRLLANIRVPWKLNLLILVMTLGIVGIFLTAMQGIAGIQARQQINFTRISAPIAALNDADIAIGELQAELLLLNNPTLSPQEQAIRLEKIANAENVIGLTLKKYEADWLAPLDLATNYEKEVVLFSQFKRAHGAYSAEAGAFYQNIKNGKYDDTIYKRLSGSLVLMQTLTRQLISIHNERMQLANENSSENYRSVTARMLFALTLVIGFGLYFSTLVARSISSRLEILSDSALGLRYDLLDRRAAIAIYGQDEIALTSRSFNTMSHRLKEMFSDLEMKVEERTASLTAATAESSKRAQQFQTVTQIAQRITSERDLDMLLSIIADVIGAQFNYHHVAIYLNDDMQEFTTLSAVSSEDGKRMMERRFKLPIKLTSLIGHVAKTGNSRTNLDAPEESYSSGASLPATRSELALPLKARDHIIGVLDVQSDRKNAFDQTDVEALTALANQITIAIQNTRLFTETQTALAESQLLYGTIVKQTWKSAMQASSQIGYRYTGTKPVPLQREISTTEIREALDSDNVAVTHPSKRKSDNALAVPLKLRESTIGVINVNFPMDTEVGEDEIDVIVAASQRIALALENAALLEESQRRAKREQTISEISAKIGSGTEVETILKTAIRELSSHISGAQITIELESEEEKG